MKTNMRDLCIPLEEYAYEQEFACALLIGLLDPLYKKYSIKLAEDAADSAGPASLAEALDSVSLPDQRSEQQPAEAPASTSAVETPEKSTPARKTSKCYGEVINELVHQLWSDLTADGEAKVKSKIEEKQNQVTVRADAAQRLRVRAITTIMD